MDTTDEEEDEDDDEEDDERAAERRCLRARALSSHFLDSGPEGSDDSDDTDDDDGEAERALPALAFLRRGAPLSEEESLSLCARVRFCPLAAVVALAKPALASARRGRLTAGTTSSSSSLTIGRFTPLVKAPEATGDAGAGCRGESFP